MSFFLNAARRLVGKAPKLSEREKVALKAQRKLEGIAVFAESAETTAKLQKHLSGSEFSGFAFAEFGTAQGLEGRTAAARCSKAPYLFFAPEPGAGALTRELLDRAMVTFRKGEKAGLVFPSDSLPPLLRRDALLQAGGFQGSVNATFRRMTRLGWSALRGSGQPFPLPPAVELELLEEPATLFLSLSGREWAWPNTARFLEEQHFPHEKIHLAILNTSHDVAFGARVKEWLSRCDYAGYSYSAERVGIPGVADVPRETALDEVRHTVANIYNHFARRCNTPLALFLEDDVLPPNDAYVRLARSFRSTTLSVSGVYLGRHERYRRGEPIAWRWAPNGKREDLLPGTGIAQVGGNGFGCLAMRGDYLANTLFRSGPPLNDFDFNFYYDAVHVENREVLLDWDCPCRHYDGPDAWV